MPISDLTSLRIAADRLDQQAAELRRRASTVTVTVTSAAWQSPAADAFRRRSTETCEQLRRCADGLEHAAAELRHHVATAHARATGALRVVGL